MPNTHEISKAIAELWVSPVKADQMAISRLEKQAGCPVEVILMQLDDVGYLEKACLEEKTIRSIPSRVSHPGKIVACGLVGASIFGAVSLVAAPEKTVEAITLGFVGSVALKIANVED